MRKRSTNQQSRRLGSQAQSGQTRRAASSAGYSTGCRPRSADAPRGSRTPSSLGSTGQVTVDDAYHDDSYYNDSYGGAQAFGSDRYRDRTTSAYRETARQRENSPTPDARDAYSVSSSSARYASASKRQRKHRRIVVGAVAALAVVLVVVGTAFGFFGGINNALHSGLDSNLQSVLTKVAAGDPFYVLLMGTDESEDRQYDEEMAGVFRTDTIILARVDPKAQTLTLVSIPRDTLVDLGEYGEQKVNAAHAFGGSTLAVKTVEQLTGVNISHYVEIDFDGFISLVDALGGVEVDVPMEINDTDAGGHVDAGLQTLNSWEALTLCRAREAYEEVVGQGDLYRAANQRLVLSAIVKKVLSSDPATMTSAINSCAQYVNTDMDVADILNLAQVFRGFNTETNMYTAVFPTESAYIGEIWWDLPQEAEWEKMRERMEQGLPPSTENVVDPVTGTVLATAGGTQSSSEDTEDDNTVHTGLVIVRNGTDYDGVGAEAGKKLEKMGFQTDVDNADEDTYPKTLILYENASQAKEAQQIAKALGGGTPTQNDGTYGFDGDFLVVIGADWPRS